MRELLSAASGAVLGLVLAVLSTPAAAQPAPPAETRVTPAIAAEYVRPHDRIDVGGRGLNLYCVGSGPRTVLLEAGGSDWSVTWALVQPALAGRARVCAYDRAGLGYSDPAPAYIPRTPAAIVEDMHALVVAAKLDRPLVLVGHSLGGFNAKLYAALYPDDVAGLVLVDPSEERSSERLRPMLKGKFDALLAARAELNDETFLIYLLDRYRRCAEAARLGPLDPASDTYRRCSDPVRAQLGDVVAAERQRIQVTPNYQLAQASEILNSIYGNLGGDGVYRELFRPGVFGAKPMLVLTHGRYDPEDPIDTIGQAGVVALAQDTARLSRRGRQRTVPDTGHNIQIEAPDAIVKAVEEVLDALDPPKPAR